jgi:hypothetical protein
MIGNCAEIFYASDGFESFRTAKTLCGHHANAGKKGTWGREDGRA